MFLFLLSIFIQVYPDSVSTYVFSNDGREGSITFHSGTVITYYNNLMVYASLSMETMIQGIPCIGVAEFYRESRSLRKCFLYRDIEINGFPIRGKSIITFHDFPINIHQPILKSGLLDRKFKIGYYWRQEGFRVNLDEFGNPINRYGG